MTDKELQKLKRSELLELMIAQSKQIIRLKKQLEQAELKRDSAGGIGEYRRGGPETQRHF